MNHGLHDAERHSSREAPWAPPGGWGPPAGRSAAGAPAWPAPGPTPAPPRPRVLLFALVLGLLGSGGSLLITVAFGLFLVLTGIPSLGQTSHDDSAGWGQFFFAAGCVLLLLALLHATAALMLVLAFVGKSWARIVALVLAGGAALALLMGLFSILRTLPYAAMDPMNALGSVPVSLMMLGPPLFYVVGSGLLLAPSVTRWYWEREARNRGLVPR